MNFGTWWRLASPEIKKKVGLIVMLVFFVIVLAYLFGYVDGTIS